MGDKCPVKPSFEGKFFLRVAESRCHLPDCGGIVGEATSCHRGILIVNGPQKAPFPSELDTIQAYLDRGGKALFLIDPEIGGLFRDKCSLLRFPAKGTFKWPAMRRISTIALS